MALGSMEMKMAKVLQTVLSGLLFCGVIFVFAVLIALAG